MSFTILGLGVALPPNVFTQERAAELTSLWSGHDETEAARLSVLYRLTAIEHRHTVMEDPNLLFQGGGVGGPSTAWRMERYDERVGPLALAAAGRALDASGVEADAISHLVTVSCTGFAAPGFDFDLIEGLGLPRGVQRTHVGYMGCHGALNGLRVARAFAESDPEARVLLCAAELCSVHLRPNPDPGQTIANALFADGAGAVVGSAEPTDRPAPWRAAANGSCFVPGTREDMSWRIGDHGFAMQLSPRVSALIGEHLRPWLSSWLDGQGLTIEDVASWAVHPGGPRILDSVRDALGLDDAALADSRRILSTCGNMSSPTILFILDHLRRRRAPLPCVALGFGPGLVIEAALFR